MQNQKIKIRTGREFAAAETSDRGDTHSLGEIAERIKQGSDHGITSV
jgi:hypothetical protein